MHASLPPSGAHRWLRCAGSARAAAEADGGASSTYADEGTAAHDLFEICNRLDADPTEFLNSRGMHKRILVNEDMATAVGHALDWSRAYLRKHSKARMLIEERVPSGAMIGLTERRLSGTPDLVLDDWPTECVVLDYKHGAGVSVEAFWNEQEMLYHAGMRAKRGPYRRYRNVVVQPRDRHEEGPVREWSFGDKLLLRWMTKTVAPKAREALRADAPRKAGEWCRFCAASNDCRTLALRVFDVARLEFKR